MELGPKDVSLLERCPHFRGWYVHNSIELGPEDVSLLERCPHFRGWYVQASMECPYRSVLNWCYVQFWMACFCLPQESASSHQTGMEYLLQAAQNGHRAAMIELARALDTGRTEEQENGSIQNDSRYIHTVIYH